MITAQTRKRRIRLLQRRLDYLDKKIGEQDPGYKGDSYDVAEAYALEWAIACLQLAIEQGLIEGLEVTLVETP